MNKEQIIKEYVRARNAKAGRASANSPIRTKEYYAELGRRSAASKRKKREADKQPAAIIYNILSGRI